MTRSEHEAMAFPTGAPRTKIATRSLTQQTSLRSSGKKDMQMTEIFRLRSCMQVFTLAESLSSPATPARKNSSSLRKCVAWDKIQIREYERSLGDHPSCSDGPPIGIGWNYDSSPKEFSVDAFESARPPRRDEFEMVLTREAREEILVTQCGATQGEIAQAVRQNRKAKFQRRRTINNLDTWDKMEEAVESARRKVKRALSFGPSSSAQLKNLQEESEKANSVISALTMIDAEYHGNTQPYEHTTYKSESMTQ